MTYWYTTAMQVDSLYQLEKLKVHYYGKITGIQVANYEDLQRIYDNKLAVDATIDAEKNNAIKDLKKRNRKLVFHNVVLSVGVSALAVTTLYFLIF